MPIETDTPVIEKPKEGKINRLRNAGAITMSALAFSGLAAPLASAEKGVSKSHGIERSYSGLKNASELTGSKIQLSPEILNRIKASTLEIAVRPKAAIAEGTEYSFSPWCTAVKVSLPGQKEPFMMTAAHCFAEATGIPNGAFRDINPNNKAEDFTDRGSNEYAIVDPGDSNLSERTAQPIATVDRIIIDTNYKDVALLHPVATDASTISSALIRHFEEVPAIPLSIAEKAPLPGTPVALYGEPQSDGYEPIAGQGTFLGKVHLTTIAAQGASPQYRQLYLVGVKPTSAEADNCNYGASGSTALLPNGQVLGILSIRSPRGYGPNHEPQQADVDNGAINWDEKWRPVFEKQLGINLSEFSVLCGYTIMDKNTPQELLSGAFHPAPHGVG